MLINNILDVRIINIIDKYIHDINENGFLLFAALMKTKGPATEASVFVLITEFQDMKSIECYSKESVDDYLRDVNNNNEKIKERRKDLIPSNVPGNILYQPGCATFNQFSTNMFSRFLMTYQYTAACL